MASARLQVTSVLCTIRLAHVGETSTSPVVPAATLTRASPSTQPLPHYNRPQYSCVAFQTTSNTTHHTTIRTITPTSLPFHPHRPLPPLPAPIQRRRGGPAVRPKNPSEARPQGQGRGRLLHWQAAVGPRLSTWAGAAVARRGRQASGGTGAS